MPVRILFLVAIAALLGAGCDDAGSMPSPEMFPRPAGAVTYYQDAKAILDGRCARCHRQGGVAPFSLTRFAEAAPVAQAIQGAVTNRTMPPWQAEGGHQVYQGDISLSKEQIGVLLSWAEQGAKEGDPAHEGLPLSPVPGGLSRVDLSLTLPEPYLQQTYPDDYRCFVLDWPLDSVRYVSGFRALPGNPANVHHVIAYLAYPEGAAAATALDQADPGPGYACYGGPGKIGLTDYDYSSLGGWNPGFQGSDYPAGTGIKVRSGSKVVLQVHYHSLDAKTPADRSTLQFKLDAAVDKEAFYVSWLNLAWLARGGMVIPKDQADVVHSFAYDPTLLTLAHTPFRFGQPFQIYSAALHLHELGTSATLAVGRPLGDADVLLRIPHWNFHWQREYFLHDPVLFQPGDRLSIECHWDNTPAHQPVRDGQVRPPVTVEWGERTQDEMCVGFLYTTAP